MRAQVLPPLPAIVALCLMPTIVSAETLPISGNYGDALGCAFAKTQQVGEEIDFSLLTPDHIRSYASLCSFERIEKRTETHYSIAARCGDEGEAGERETMLDISGDGETGYTIVFAEGQQWGPLPRCE